MKKERAVAIEKEIIRVISGALLTEVKNPKIQGIVSVTRAKVADDLKYADVYFSILPPIKDGNEVNKEEVIKGLEEIKGFLRKKIASDIALRYTPEMRVKIDDSMEYAAKINKILNDLKG